MDELDGVLELFIDTEEEDEEEQEEGDGELMLAFMLLSCLI